MGYKTSWIIAPKGAVERLKDLNSSYELVPNNVLHMMTDEMLSSGYYYEYLEQISSQLVRQYYAVQKLLDIHLSDIASWRRDYPSFFIWIEIKNIPNIFKLFTQSKEFLFFPGVFCEPKNKKHIRLNIFGVKDSDLEKWICNISELLRKKAG